jgi:hypothetical protein
MQTTGNGKELKLDKNQKTTKFKIKSYGIIE